MDIMTKFHLLFVMSIFHIFLIGDAITPRNLDTDKQSLLEFKHRIIDPHNILTNNWTSDSSVCNWIRVNCSAKHNRVRSLNLSSMGLIASEIPPHLGNLSFLTFLDLSNNEFRGEFPTWFGRLSKLIVLSLRENFLTGTIPLSLSNISDLKVLESRHNSLHGYISSEIMNLKSLISLSIGGNNFSGSIPRNICRNLPDLEWLFLYDNKFSGPIPSTIGECQNLQQLMMYNNRFGGNIPGTIGNLTKLELIYMHSTSLGGKLPDELFNASKLSILDLADNSFSGDFPNKLCNLASLEVLHLWSNNLTPEITSNGELTFFSSLAACRNLKILYLQDNPFNGILPPSLSNLPTSLQLLSLSSCKIRGSIPSEIGNLTNITSIFLSSNELSGSIPATIGRLKKLQLLDLRENKLRSSIPHELCGAESLYELRLSANELDGPLPICLDALISLRNLYLDFNKLHSTIPSSLWSLKDVLDIDLSSNNLSGSLPPEIGNLKVLVHLNLSRNFLSGDIPSTFGSLRELQDLDLSSNRFRGSIPESLGDMISLESLDLSRNYLSGVIPKSLEKLSHLSYFNVSVNGLEGEIPGGGSFVNFTAESFMNNYALCGSPKLQVQPCKNEIRQSNKTLLHVLIYVLPALVASIIIFSALIIVYKKRQRGSTNLATKEDFLPIEKWRRITYHQLMQGTGGFSENKLLGSGSFGSVYKGVLADGTIVAVKVFNLQIAESFRSFDVECEVLSQILHRNLVKVISCCSNVDFKALVLEFMPKGSLDKWLYSSDCFLDILQRINIMIDVASALEYLHLGHPNPVIHCDIKPSNVLLDEDMVAHVADFGLAKLLEEEDSVKQTVTLATIGYMAPEYGSAGIISIKSDVYSYGILLMEVFTRKKPISDFFAEEMNIKSWIKMSLSSGIIGIVDSSLLYEDDEHFVIKANCVWSIMELALDCSTESPDDRIEMKDVVYRLQYIKKEFLNNIKACH